MQTTSRPHLLAAKGLFLALVLTLAPLVREGSPSQIRTWALSLGEASRVEAPGEFGLLGVSWPSDEPAPQGVEVRTSVDGRRWTEWSHLHVPDRDEGPDLGSEDRGIRATTPLWVGRAKMAEVQWEGRPPKGAEVQVVDPGPDPEPSALSSADAMTAQPGIISRAQWGANESMRRGSPSYASSVRMAFIHHTATTNSYSAGESAGIVRSIYAYHVNSNGWDDIGYNFLVDRYGQIFEGRSGGIDRAVIGAHSGGFNTGSTGIAIIGSFESVGPPQAAWNSVQNTLAWKLDLGHVDPLSTVSMVSGGSNKYAAGTTVNLPAISGHRDVGHTTCPGNGIYNLLPNVRSAVNTIGRPKLYSPTRSRYVLTPNGDGVAESVDLSVRPSDEGSWTLSVLDRAGSTVRSTTGSGSMAWTWDGRNAASQVVPHGEYRMRWQLNALGSHARPAEIPVLLGAWPNDLFLSEPGDPKVYRMFLGRLQHVPSEATFLSHAAWSEVATVAPGTVAAYPKSGSAQLREGVLVVGDNPSVYLVSEGRRRPIRSASDFNAAGYRWDAIRTVPESDINALPLGQPVDPSTSMRPSGTVMKGSGSSVYWWAGGALRRISSAPAYESWFRWNEIVTVPDTELLVYPPGSDLGFRDGSVVLTSDGRAWLISQGQRRHITSEATFYALGYAWGAVRRASLSEAAVNPIGPPV